jgi:hypothetical protein
MHPGFCWFSDPDLDPDFDPVSKSRFVLLEEKEIFMLKINKFVTRITYITSFFLKFSDD